MQKKNHQTAAFYDAEAKSYDQSRYASRRGQRVDRFQKYVLKSFTAREPMHKGLVLELGCGTGRMLPFMAKQSGKVVGIDISSGMLKVARQCIHEAKLTNVHLILSDALDLPFPDNQFDLVYSILVINLIQDYKRTFLEVRRVLKDSGVFIFSVPNLQSIYFPGGLIVNWRSKAFGSNPSGYRYSHWFTKREITSALDGAGFTLETVSGQPPWTTLVNNPRSLPGTFLGRMLSKSLYICARAQ